MKNEKEYWSGFAAGALIGAAAGAIGWAANNLITGRKHDSRVLRMERSIQIGRSVEDVFHAWSEYENLPQHISLVEDVRREGERSSWSLSIDGRSVRFTAEQTQHIPNESIGWKSVKGPKHSGRITFGRVGNQTLLHVTMNYAPPAGRLAFMLKPIEEELEAQLEEALREFKSSLEGDGSQEKVRFMPDQKAQHSGVPFARELRGTGTHGSGTGNPLNTTIAQPDGFSGPNANIPQRSTTNISRASSGPAGPVTLPNEPGADTVDYTRPPEKKYP